MKTDTGTVFKKLKEATPYIVDEYLVARAAWETSPQSEVPRKWKYCCEVFAKHYKREGEAITPISPEAIELAKQYANQFKAVA